ncbi:MAG TPA: carboxypeptidase-like regulatory domain-containing protein, partial [Caulobacteraceae bacterium]
TAASVSGGLFGQGTVGASFAVTNTTNNATTFQVTSTSTSGAQLTSTSDAIDHTQDRFFLWLNAVITVKQTGPSTAVYSIGTANNAPMDVIDVSVAELKNTSLIPAAKMGQQTIHGVVLPGLSALKPADFTSIATMDVLTSPTATPSDTARYVYIKSLPLEGPDAKATDAVKNTYAIADGSATAHTKTETENTSASLSVGEKVEIPGIFTESVTDTGTLTWNHSNSSGTTSATSSQATVVLGTAKVGCYEYVDIYSDTMFHSMAYVTAQPTCAPVQPSRPGFPIVGVPVTVLSGTLENAQAQPLAHQTVTVTLADGSVRQIVTNSKGQYMVYEAPAGTARIQAAGVTSQATIVPGKPTALDLKAK